MQAGRLFVEVILVIYLLYQAAVRTAFVTAGDVVVINSMSTLDVPCPLCLWIRAGLQAPAVGMKWVLYCVRGNSINTRQRQETNGHTESYSFISRSYY